MRYYIEYISLHEIHVYAVENKDRAAFWVKTPKAIEIDKQLYNNIIKK